MIYYLYRKEFTKIDYLEYIKFCYFIFIIHLNNNLKGNQFVKLFTFIYLKFI